MQLSEKRQTFSQFFVPFLESTSKFKHFLKRMIVIANVFPKLNTVKILLRPVSKKHCFRTRFDSQHVKALQILMKSPCEYFCHVFSPFSGQLIWKMSPLVLGKVLGVFVNGLTADDTYLFRIQRIRNSEFRSNYLKSKKNILNFFPFLESTLNFKYF